MKDNTLFETLTEIHTQSDLGMYYCGKRIETKNHCYGPEIRNHYLFVLVNKGNAVLQGKKSIPFGEHDLLVMCPNEKIHYKALSDWSISWIGLYGKTVSEYMDLLGINAENPIIHISLYNELKALLDNIYDTSKDMSLSTNLSIIGLLYEFFAILIENSNSNQKTDLIKTALKIIDYNFCTDISVAQIAKQLSINPVYFSKIFTKRTGLSPKKYILEKRISRAKELLRYTNANIFEISNSVGYEDQLYFSRLFKKYTNLSPIEYRHQNKSGV